MKKTTLLFKTMLSCMIIFMVTALSAHSQQVMLRGKADAVVFEQFPDSTASYYHPTNIKADRYAVADTVGAPLRWVVSYIKFDITPFSNRVVKNAQFTTRGQAKAETAPVIRLRRAGTNLRRDTTTWANRPTLTGNDLATKTYTTSSARRPYDNIDARLVEYINDALARGLTEIGLALQYLSGDLNAMNWIGGVGDGTWGPELTLEFDTQTALLPIEDASAFKHLPELTAITFQTGNDNGNIFVNRKNDDTLSIAYLKFHLAGMAYKKISAATLSTRGASKAGTEFTVQLRRAGPNFARDTTNWNNRPNIPGGKLATKLYTPNSARSQYVPEGNNLINYINEELAKGNEYITFSLQYDSGDPDAGNWIGGKGNGYAFGPHLMITPDKENYSAFAINDAVVFEHNPAATGASFHASNLYVNQTDTTRAISYVQFDISGFSGRVVKDVKFSTRGSMLLEGQEMKIRLTQAGDMLRRDTTNWNNRPATTGNLASATMVRNSARRYYDHNGANLINYVNSKLQSGASVITFGLVFDEGQGGNLQWIGGKGDGNFGPQLEFVFENAFNSFPSADAVVYEHLPEQTAVHATNLHVAKTDDINTMSFVKFNIADIAGMEVVEARFSNRQAMQTDKFMTVRLTRAGTDFSRAETNWNNRPTFSSELATVNLDNVSARKYYENVGQSLVNYINEHTLFGKTEVAFGIQFKSGDGDGLNWMGGKGDAAWGPILELTIRPDLERDTIFVMADAFVDQANPTVNNGAAFDMGIRKSDDGTDLETYLKFNLANAADAVIGKTEIMVYIGQHNSGEALDNFLFELFAVEDQTWLEEAINWENKPAAGLKILEGNVTWHNTGQLVAFSSDALTHYMNAAIAAGKTHVSLVLKGKSNTPGKRLWMAGREWITSPLRTARLVFDYTVPPPPQNLPVVADSYVSQVAAERDTNFGKQADQHLINDDANEASKWIYFRYDLGSAYGEGISATLNVYGSIHDGAPGLAALNFAVYSSTNVTWHEDSITWNNKPAVGSQALLTGTLLQGGRWFALTSAAFTEFVNQAIREGRQYVTLVAKATDATPGQRGWLSGREWRASYITLNYEPEVALPRFSPNPGMFIRSVDVVITTPTANAAIYYTLDNSDPSTTNGTLYTGPVKLEATDVIKTINVRARAYAAELNPSGIAQATYTVTPVGLPQFSPTPLVSYQGNVEVTLSVEPAGSIIRYSTDGGNPTTLYDGPFLLQESAIVKAQAFSSDFLFATAVVEASYEVIQTVPAPGVGPAGVGFADLSRENQPELSLWLRAHDLTAAHGDKITMWNDRSGNNNHAHNDESTVGSSIPNTGESWKAAPTFVADGLNGWPTVHFGTQIGGDAANVKNLVVNDADNLDGGAGISIFMVVKRNQMHPDFAAIFQKRDIRNQPAQASYVLEMDGGANPNKMQFVIARDIFLKSIDEFNATDYYIVNVALNSRHRLSTFMTNGVIKSSALYQKPIQSTHAPVIIGGFQPVDIAEIVMFNSDVNHAQTILVKNYLAAKYGMAGVNGVFYTSTTYVHDIIGVGRAANVAGADTESHNFSAGGGLQLFTAGLGANGDFIIAGHNGVALNDNNNAKSWTRFWNLETAGNGGNVTMGFDFETPGITSDPSTSYKLWHKVDANAAWTDLGITPTIAGKVLNFAVTGIQKGIYGIGIEAPGATSSFDEVRTISSGIEVYPNPARDRVTVVLEDKFSGNVEIRIRDIYGRLVAARTVLKDAASISSEFGLEGLRNGTYMIEVTDGKERSVKLFMIH